MKRKSKFSLSTAQIIMLSFALAIAVGTLLLLLPISSKTGKSVGVTDALFTATTSTCVTGLVTLPTFSTWSIFGQAVILILIQIGGLGIITVMSGFMLAIRKKMGLGDRLLIQDAFNLNTLSGLTSFIKKVIIGTLIVEGAGALLYMTVFVPQFGATGIWISVFNSVSAFCNAGIDIISENSLCDYATHPMINAVTCILIILGGIGYIVWWDLARVLSEFKRKKLKCLRSLTLHSKIAITATAILIFAGAALIFIFEYDNPKTIADMSLFDKIQVSFFQSVTTRTAGFATLPQENLTNASAILSLLLMFIGGSPVGTAGGIKTVTVALLITSAISTVKGKDEISVFGRNISKNALRKAVAVLASSFAIMFISSLALSACMKNTPALDILYETVSATATVGLTRGVSSVLNTAGKLIISATMYLGRVGPISLAFALNISKKSHNIVKNPTEDISVG
ncbi:MAG: potassium transporter KtrB [Ruminococcaceae bacterium]|nr:potassium transporter KtrB [Oscillospiraceae bacterium]